MITHTSPRLRESGLLDGCALEILRGVYPECNECVWVTNLVTLGGYQHRSHREELVLPLHVSSPPACWSTMYGNRKGHEVGTPYRMGSG